MAREHFDLGRFLSSVSHIGIDEQIDALWEQFSNLMNSQIVCDHDISRRSIAAKQHNQPLDIDWLNRAKTASRTYGLQMLQIQSTISRLRRVRHISRQREHGARFVAAARRILDTDTLSKIEHAAG